MNASSKPSRRTDMPAPFKLFGVFNDPETESAVLDVLRSGQISAGIHVEAFRTAFGELIANSNIVTTNDVSAAMAIALRLAAIGPGDEVIVSPFSCLSSNAPIGISGATMVWADIDPQTASLSVASVRRLLSGRTRAVVLYHVAGYPGPADEVADLCQKAGIKLIEDCNNGLGATLDGRPLGGFGDLATYSFYPNRQINAIDGGAVACRADDDFRRAMLLRRYGIDSARFRDVRGEIDAALDVPELGWAATLSNLHSAFALALLPGLPDRQARTFANAERLRALLSGVPGLILVDPLPGAVPAYWAVLALVNQRDRLLEALKGSGVEVSMLHHRNDTYTGFAARRSSLPGVDRFMAEVIAFPCGWWLEPHDIDEIGAITRRALAALV